MEGDTLSMKKAIWIGSTSIFLLYTLWNLMIMGIVPGKDLFATLLSGGSSLHSLEQVLENSLISGIADEFAILAISTSFLGVSISFFDFWADTMHWEKKGLKGSILVCVVFAIPLFFALTYPGIFIEALNLGGEVGSSLLLGIFPVLFVWIGRYYKYRGITPELLPGGKLGLSLIVLASLAVLVIKHVVDIKVLPIGL
jgi:tyrosine-specific transport protein